MSTEQTATQETPVTPAHTGDTMAIVDGKPVPITPTEPEAKPEENPKEEEKKDKTPTGEAEEPEEKESPDEEAESSDKEKEEAEKKKKKSVPAGDRIKEYSRRYRNEQVAHEATRAQLAEKDARIAELEGRKAGDAPKQEEAKAKEITMPVMPDINDFETYEEFQKAKNEYPKKLQEWVEATTEAKLEVKEAEKRAKAEEAELKALIDKGAEKYEDFPEMMADEDMQALLGGDSPIGAAVTEAKNMADVTKYLYDHPEMQAELAKMSEVKAVMEIGKIDASFNEDNKETGEKKETKKTKSDAPPPVKTLGAGGDATGKTIYEATSMEEFVKLRRAKKT